MVQSVMVADAVPTYSKTAPRSCSLANASPIRTVLPALSVAGVVAVVKVVLGAAASPWTFSVSAPAQSEVGDHAADTRQTVRVVADAQRVVTQTGVDQHLHASLCRLHLELVVVVTQFHDQRQTARGCRRGVGD